MNELRGDRKEHESKTLRPVGGLFVLSDEMACVCVSDEMDANDNA